MDESPACRMCYATLEELEDELLICPCNCRGSLAFVHYSCLLKNYESRQIWWNLACPTCERMYAGRVAVELGHYGLSKCEEAFGQYSLEVAATLLELGNAYGQDGHSEQQYEILERALAIQTAALGSMHPDLAFTLTSIGFACGALGNIDQQLRYTARALKINEEAYGPNGFEVARTLTVLANAYDRLGIHQKQRDLQQRALSIFEEIKGASDPIVCTALLGLANAHGNLGNPLEKQQLLERALKIMVQHCGTEDVQVAIIEANLAKAYEALGQISLAIFSMWHAARVLMRECGELDKDAQLATQAIESLRKPQDAVVGAQVLRLIFSAPCATSETSVEDLDASDLDLIACDVPVEGDVSNGSSFLPEQQSLEPERTIAMFGAQLLRHLYSQRMFVA